MRFPSFCNSFSNSWFQNPTWNNFLSYAVPDSLHFLFGTSWEIPTLASFLFPLHFLKEILHSSRTPSTLKEARERQTIHLISFHCVTFTYQDLFCPLSNLIVCLLWTLVWAMPPSIHFSYKSPSSILQIFIEHLLRALCSMLRIKWWIR